jgi:hypothetical protein
MVKIETLFPTKLVKDPFDATRLSDIKAAFQNMLSIKLERKSSNVKKWKPIPPEEFEKYLEDINTMPEVVKSVSEAYELVVKRFPSLPGVTESMILTEIDERVEYISTDLQKELTPEIIATYQENYPDKNREEGGKLGQFKNSKTPVKYIVDIEPLKKGHEGEETKKYLSETFHKLLRYTNIGSSTPDINKPISRDDLFQYISDMNVLLEVVDLITEAYEKLLETYTNKKNPKRNEIIDMVKEIIIPLDAALQEELTEAKIKEDQELFPDELLIKKNERRFV